MSLPSLTADGIRAVNAGIVTATGANTLSTASTTGAAIYAEGDTKFVDGTTFLNFVSVESDNINGSTGSAVPPPLRAISIVDNVPEGTINITGNFTVPINGSNATGENILNNGATLPVIVSGSTLTPIP